MRSGPRASKGRRGAAFFSPLLLLGLGSTPLLAQTSSPPSGEREANLSRALASEVWQVFASRKNAVVRIEAVDRMGPHIGTGFFVDPSGTIFTDYSVAGESWDITVEFAEKKYPAKCSLADARSGVALLKIEADTPFLPLGQSDTLEPAMPVVVIGYSRDLPVTFSYGPVTGLVQKAFGGYLLPARIQADVLVHPGEQGAPVLNLRGEAVGIVAARLGDTMACLVMPVKAAEKIRRDYLRFGEPRPGYLGVDISPPLDFAGEGPTETRVADLAPDSPALHAGLRPGDVLLQIGDVPIERPSDVLNGSFYMTGGDEVPICVLRNGEKLTLRVQAGDEPDSPRVRAAKRQRFNAPAAATLGPRSEATRAEAEQTARLRLERDR